MRMRIRMSIGIRTNPFPLYGYTDRCTYRYGYTHRYAYKKQPPKYEHAYTYTHAYAFTYQYEYTDIIYVCPYPCQEENTYRYTDRYTYRYRYAYAHKYGYTDKIVLRCRYADRYAYRYAHITVLLSIDNLEHSSKSSIGEGRGNPATKTNYSYPS